MIRHHAPLMNQHLDQTSLSSHPVAFRAPTTILTQHGRCSARRAAGVAPCLPPVFHTAAHMTCSAEKRRSWATAHVSTAWRIYHNEQLKQKRNVHRENSQTSITRPDSGRHKDLNLLTDPAKRNKLDMNPGKDGQQLHTRSTVSPDKPPWLSEVTLDPPHLHSHDRKRRCKSVTFEPVKRLKVLDRPYLVQYPPPPLQDVPCGCCDLFPQQSWHETSDPVRGFRARVLDSYGAAHLHSPFVLRPNILAAAGSQNLLHPHHYHSLLHPGLLALTHLKS